MDLWNVFAEDMTEPLKIILLMEMCFQSNLTRFSVDLLQINHSVLCGGPQRSALNLFLVPQSPYVVDSNALLNINFLNVGLVFYVFPHK